MGRTRRAKPRCRVASQAVVKRYSGEANHWFGLRKGKDNSWRRTNGTAFNRWLVPLSRLGARGWQRGQVCLLVGLEMALGGLLRCSSLRGDVLGALGH